MSRDDVRNISFIVRMNVLDRCEFLAEVEGGKICTNYPSRHLPRGDRLCFGNLLCRPKFCPIKEVEHDNEPR